MKKNTINYALPTHNGVPGKWEVVRVKSGNLVRLRHTGSGKMSPWVDPNTLIRARTADLKDVFTGAAKAWSNASGQIAKTTEQMRDLGKAIVESVQKDDTRIEDSFEQGDPVVTVKDHDANIAVNISEPMTPYKVETLRKVARTLGVTGYSKMKKDDLIEAIRNYA